MPLWVLASLLVPGAALAEAEPLSVPLIAVGEEYDVRSGDTLLRIAARHELSVDQLLAANPQLESPDRIRAGDRLLVPLVLPQEEEDDLGCELLIMAEEEGIALPMPTVIVADDGGPLIFEDRVTEVFRRELRALAGRLGVEPDYLMAIIHYETGGSFSPSIRNPSTNATGLIQFLPSTARALGTTVEELAAMSALEQLAWVERYFARFRGRLETLEDAYMAVLYPIAVGEPLDFVLFSEGSASYQRNPYLDSDQDGVVTKGEVGEAIRRVYERGLEAAHRDAASL